MHVVRFLQDSSIVTTSAKPFVQDITCLYKRLTCHLASMRIRVSLGAIACGLCARNMNDIDKLACGCCSGCSTRWYHRTVSWMLLSLSLLLTCMLIGSYHTWWKMCCGAGQPLEGRWACDAHQMWYKSLIEHALLVLYMLFEGASHQDQQDGHSQQLGCFGSKL